MNLRRQLVQLGAEDGERGGIYRRRSDLPSPPDPRIRWASVPAPRRHVYARERGLRAPIGGHLYLRPYGLGEEVTLFGVSGDVGAGPPLHRGQPTDRRISMPMPTSRARRTGLDVRHGRRPTP